MAFAESACADSCIVCSPGLTSASRVTAGRSRTTGVARGPVAAGSTCLVIAAGLAARTGEAASETATGVVNVIDATATSLAAIG